MVQQVVWYPNPGPQTALIACPIEDILYGGARGGGKTGGMLGDFLQHAATYGRHARGVFFRKTMAELEEVQRQAIELYTQLDAVYLVAEDTWVFPNGASLKMRFLRTLADYTHYHGHSYTWLGYDDAGEWPDPKVIDRMRSTLRSDAGVPCVMRLSANPGGPGHAWLKERYIIGRKPMVPHQDPATGIWRVFIPAKLRDNPYLDPKEYTKNLLASGPAWLVKAWLEGDWDVVPTGGFFNVEKIVESSETPRLDRLYQGWDGAVSGKDFQRADYSAGATVGRDALGRYWLTRMRRERWNSRELVEGIISEYRLDEPERVWVEGGVIGKAIDPFMRERLRELELVMPLEYVQVGRKDKVARAAPLQAVIEQGNLYVPKGAPWLRAFYDELVIFNGDDSNKDDQVDAASHVFMQMNRLRTSGAEPKNTATGQKLTGTLLEQYHEQLEIERTGKASRKSRLHF